MRIPKWDWSKKSKEEGFRIRHFKNGDRLVGTMIIDKNADLPLDHDLYFGLSIVSNKDRPNKEIGRRIALNRYYKAKRRRESTPICTTLDLTYTIPKYGCIPLENFKLFLTKYKKSILPSQTQNKGQTL